MGKSPCCDKEGLKKGPWKPEEDHKLMAYIQEHGHGSWRALPPKAGLQRCGKSCRLRWTNYLRPDIKRGEFSLQEQQTIIQLHALLGNRWSTIASHLPKRTDNQIKNYWNTHLKKRLTKMGIDPATHKPQTHALSSAQHKDIANLSHMVQWEMARLEAEARIIREARPNPSFLSPVANESAYATCPPPTARPPCLDILRAWQVTNRSKTDILLLEGVFMGGQQLESPKGVDPMIAYAGSIFMAPVNYGTVGAERLEGIMVNSPMKENGFITDVVPDFFSDSPRFPSFFEGLSADTAVFVEDNRKSNIFNVVSSPFDSSVF